MFDVFIHTEVMMMDRELVWCAPIEASGQPSHAVPRSEDCLEILSVSLRRHHEVRP